MRQPFYYGAAWYPELWPECEQDREIELMRAAHLNMIRLGEFAWSTLEPTPGRRDFDWLERVMDKLHAAGIAVVLGTPTATPPRWFTLRHPDAYHVTAAGVVMSHGGRQQVCLAHPAFRRRAVAISAALARRFGNHPALVAWQLDNEPKGSANGECFCAVCQAGFAPWLARRYNGDIAALNQAWGTRVWSQNYRGFDEIPAPLPTPAGHNPSLTTAYCIYQQEIARDFIDAQATAVRRYAAQPVTLNSNPRHQLDHVKQFEHLDFVAFDEYPAPGDYSAMLFNYALWRSLKPQTPFWLMETSPSHGGCIFGGYQAQPPGFHYALGIAGLGAGLGAFSYWLWRRQRCGMEMPHGALLNSWGTPAEGYAQAVRLGREFEVLHDRLADSVPVRPPVALLYSDVARTFFRTEPLNDIDYVTTMQHAFRTVIDTGRGCDILSPNSDLQHCAIVWTPYLPDLPDELRLRLQQWVEAGGTWIAGPLCGYRTPEHTARTDAALGREFEQWAGVETKFFYGIAPDGRSGEVGLWHDQHYQLPGIGTFFATTEATAEATISGGFADGLAWLTRCRRGTGEIIMLGALPTQYNTLLHSLLQPVPPETSAGNCVIHRRSPSGIWQLAINLDGQGGSVGDVTIPPWDYRIIEPME